MSKSLAVLALAATSALATVFITNPTSSTTLHGGQPATINWQDDGTVPSLADFGNAKVSIYVGNALQQTSLQTIVDSVNVATTSSIQFISDPNIGPNSSDYFIRIESLTFKDPKNPQFPALSFSAKFTMDNMSGTFNSTIQAQIAGQSTAPLLAGDVGTTSSVQTSTTTTSSLAISSTPKVPAESSHSNSALHSKAGWTSVVLSALLSIAAL